MHERTIFYSTFEEVSEALAAADTLGLGFRVHNAWTSNEPGAVGSHTMHYVLEIFDDAPGGDDEDDA